ncbi:MAG: hypothetical protein P1P84_20930 [Deferrisomatales bacterium]|nr:hypothetical protein [Deferrisomatales bacterium]
MRTTVVAAILMTLGIVSTGIAFIDDPEAGSLQGAPRNLRITIEDLGPDAAGSGLTAERLQATVIAQLTGAGFRVDEAAPTTVHIGVGLSPVRGAGLVAYSVCYSFDQPVRLERDNGVRLTAPTWLVVHTGTAFSAKLSDSVLLAIQGLGERFVNSFDAVNPPGG